MPDWHAFQRYNGSTQEFYGLWAYCQEQSPTYGTVCKRWPTAENQLFNGSRPNFIRTSQGLITTGMILLSLGLFSGIVALLLPILNFAAALLAFLAFLFLVIGLPIFGEQSNDFSASRGDATYNKRYGFWLMVPTIVLEFLSILCFAASGVLYRLYGFGNITSSLGKSHPIYGGQRMLGPPISMSRPQYGFGAPWMGRMSPPLPAFPPPMPYSPMTQRSIVPGLLSEYLSQQSSQFLQPTILPPIALNPAPQIMPAASYLRAGEPAGPPFQPIINLTGRTIVGPLRTIT